MDRHGLWTLRKTISNDQFKDINKCWLDLSYHLGDLSRSSVHQIEMSWCREMQQQTEGSQVQDGRRKVLT